MSCKVVVVDSTEAGQADFAADALKVKTANPEIVRGLLLDPRLLLIDMPSSGLSPLMVQEPFSPLRQLRDKGVSILMIEQNARSALKMSDYGLELELGRTRMHDTAPAILARLSYSSAVLSKG
jgi:ABC-type branched-subunit amino acid transport system ATPase component